MNIDSALAFAIPLATALGCGLLIGVERERRKSDSESRPIAGIRTFALAALLGALLQKLDLVYLTAAGGLLVVLLIAIGYARGTDPDVGITTELALFVTFVIGIVAVIEPRLAAAVAVVVFVLLLARTWLHRFATETLTHAEVRDGTLLLGIALIALPLLPNQDLRLFGAINPHQIGVVAVTLLAIQTVAHIALRVLGEKLGAALSGFLSGLVSSSATFAAMAARARAGTGSAGALVAAALLSEVASMFQLLALVAVVKPLLLGQLLIAVGLGATLIVAACVWLLQVSSTTPGAETVGRQRMFNPLATLAFVGLLTAVTMLVSWAKTSLGAAAADIAATLAALVDLHAAAGAVLSLRAETSAEGQETMTALLLILSVNAFSKAAISVGGGRAFFFRTSGVLLCAVAACWVPQLVSG